MKLSKLTEVLNNYNKQFIEKQFDPDVVVRSAPFEEKDLVDDFCTTISSNRDDMYLCLFTFDENEESGETIHINLAEEDNYTFCEKIKNWFICKWQWLKDFKYY